MLARLRRRQHPQCHGHADGGDRSAGNSRHSRICREWHYHILNDRSLTGLRASSASRRRRGEIAVLEDTNDILFGGGVKDGFGAEPGVWFRLGIGGITGHKDFANARHHHGS